MALFDIAHMGKDFLKERKRSSSSGNDEGSDTPAPLDSFGSLSDVEQVQSEDDGDDCASVDSESSSRRFRMLNSMSLRSFSLRSRSRSPSPAPAKLTTDEKLKSAVYQSINVGLSNELTIKAYKAGYGPAFTILKSMNRSDREKLMKTLFIKRKGATCNDEVDAYDILFRKVYGIRGRTSTALRSLRVMKRPTWVHTIFKVATALETNTKMVISSGDWRLPTRLTEKMTTKEALKATTEEFYGDGESALLSRAENKFYKKLQRNIEARLGEPLASDIRKWFVKQAGEEYAHLFEAKEEIKEDKKREKRAKMSEKKALDKKKVTVGEDATGEKVEDPELKLLEDSFHIPRLIGNIEKVKPGFGKYSFLIILVFVLRAKEMEGEEFNYSNQKELLKKMAIVGAKDGIIGLSLGIPLATFVNPFLGFPLMAMSFINLSCGSTEFQMIEPVCVILLHQLLLASNGTCVHEISRDVRNDTLIDDSSSADEGEESFTEPVQIDDIDSETAEMMLTY